MPKRRCRGSGWPRSAAAASQVSSSCLAEIAAAEHLSLRAYLARLADTLLTPAERAERAEQARQRLSAWNGYNPDATDTQQLDAELDRRLAKAGGQ